MTVAEAASRLGAHPCGDGSWYEIDCPKCGATDALSLTERGYLCRSAQCDCKGTDLDLLISAEELPRAIAAIDVRADKPPSLDFEGLAVGNEIHVLASDGGVGKTSLALAIAGSYASGSAALDRFPCLVPGPVLFVSEEDSEGVLRNRMGALCAGHGWPVAEVLARVHLLCLAGVRIDQAHWQRHLVQEVERIDARAVLIDPWYDVLGGEENSNSDVRPAVQFLRQLATRATVYICAHAGKASEGKRKIDRIRGASALHSAARVVYFLEADERGMAVHPLKFSRGEVPRPFVVSRTVGSDPLNQAAWRSARLTYLTPDVAQGASAEKFVTDLLARYPGLTTTQIKTASKGTGSKAPEISTAIATLEKRGVITFEEGARNSKRWRLATSLPENIGQGGQGGLPGCPDLAGQGGSAPPELAPPFRGASGAGGQLEDPTDILVGAVE